MPDNGPISGFTEMGATAPAAADELVVVDKSDTTDAATGTTKRWEWLDFLRELFATRFGADAGSNDTYVVTLTPAPVAYVTGEHYRFKANTANTGACTINFNSLGAKTIKKAAGGITTDLADNDIRAGQWVDLVYDGTNMQMQSQLGNTPSGGGSPGGSDGDIQYRVDGSTFGGSPLKRLSADVVEQRNGTTIQQFRVFRTWTSSTNHDGLRVGDGGSGDMVVGTFQGSGGGAAQTLHLQGNSIFFHTGTSSFTERMQLNPTEFIPSTTNQITLGNDAKNYIQLHVRTGVMFNDGATNASSPKIIRTDGSLEVKTLNDGAPTYLFFKDAGRKVVTAQFDKTNTTLANITGLTEEVRAGVTYSFEVDLFIDADATGGFKFAIGGTATATSIIYQIQFLDNAADTYTVNSRQTALAGSDGAAGPTAGYCRIKGTIVVNAAGTLTVQFAQNAANGTSSVLVNSTFRVEKF